MIDYILNMVRKEIGARNELLIAFNFLQTQNLYILSLIFNLLVGWHIH